MAYERPQVTVDQNMTIKPRATERDQPAFVFGPNYELHRYSNASEKGKIAVDVYNGQEMKLRYPGVMDDSAVDKGYTKVFGDNVIVSLYDMGTANLPEQNIPPAKLAANGGYTLLLFAGKVYVDHNRKGVRVTREPDLKRNIAVGDVLQVSYGAEPVKFFTKVLDIQYQAEEWTDLDSDSSSEGPGGTLVTVEDAIPEGISLDSVSATLVDILDGVEFPAKNFSEKDGVKYQWEQKEVEIEGETVNNGVQVNKLWALDPAYFKDRTSYAEVISADLYIEYRELLQAYSDTLHSLVGSSEVEDALGAVSPDNPLAQGVYNAALNAATDDGDEAPPVYFMAVPLNEMGELDYASVLNKATLTDRAYVFAPTTRDEAVLEMVRNHVLEMSSKTQKKWRIAVVSAEVPRGVSKLNPNMDSQGDAFYAIPVSATGGIAPDPAGKFTMLRVVKNATSTSGNPSTSFRSTLAVGDKVSFRKHPNFWNEEVWDEYVVKRIVNNNTVEIDGVIDTTELETGTDSYVPEEIEIFHEYTPAETAEVVASTSRAFATRRMYNVFPPQFSNDGVSMTGEFAACAVAGLISATEPQQPITNVTVRGIDNVPLVYSTYNSAELDVMAEGGTFIVAQDLPGDRVYVRHQISTAYSDGNLNTAELSVTKNVDSISYAFAEVFEPFHGKNNITPAFVAALGTTALALIRSLASGASAYGPQLIGERTEILYVRENEFKADHVDIGIRLGVPYPCNNIDIVLTV